MNLKRITVFFITFVTVLSCFAVNAWADNTDTNISKEKSFIIGSGESINLSSELETADGSEICNCETSDFNVASIIDGVFAVGVCEGTAHIKAYTSANTVITCIITVMQAPNNKNTEAICKSQNIVAGNKSKIYVEFNGCASYSKTYTSSNRSVAVVDDKGTIKAKKEGTCVIKVTLYNGVSKKVKIRVCDKCFPLNETAFKIALKNEHVKYVKYGTSSQGRPLEAYIITGNKKYTKTIILSFAIHGFEDAYYRDGKVLIKEANKLVEYYSKHTDKLKNVRMIIVPALNPDGVIAGKNNLKTSKSSFGRCTARHIDMNRDFKSGKFKAVESQAYRKFLQKYKPDVYIDFHGWLNESIGNPSICNLANSTIKLRGSQKNYYGTSYGYLAGYVHKKYNCPTAIVEYPSPKNVSHQRTYQFVNKLITKYNKKP